MLDAGETADKRVGSNADELMRRRRRREWRNRRSGNAGQHHIIGQNDALADAAIMRDVGVGQEHRPRPDDRFEPPPAVPGFIVTPSRMRQSSPITRRTGSPRYLRSCGGCPIEAKGKMARARRPWCHRPGSHARQAGRCRRASLRPDMAKRPDLDSRPEQSAVFDDGGRMDRTRHSRTSIADTSASQTSTPSTFASPRNHHMLRRLATRVI